MGYGCGKVPAIIDLSEFPKITEVVREEENNDKVNRQNRLHEHDEEVRDEVLICNRPGSCVADAIGQ